MLLTVSTTHRPARDLGYLLHKHPDRVQEFRQAFGTVTVLFPEATDERSDDEQPESLADVKAPAEGPNGIPEFWLTALKNHIALSELITERDEEALRALVDVRMSYLVDQAGFKLEFEFDAAKYR